MRWVIGAAALLLLVSNAGWESGAVAAGSDWPISASKSSKSWLIGEWQMVPSQCVHPEGWYTREVYTPTEWARLVPPNGYSPGWKTYPIYKYVVSSAYAWVQLGPSASETGKVYYVDANHIKEENQLGPTCVYARVQ